MYVPAAAFDGIISPDVVFNGSPVRGCIEKIPPLSPESVTATGGFETLLKLHRSAG